MDLTAWFFLDAHCFSGVRVLVTGKTKLSSRPGGDIVDALGVNDVQGENTRIACYNSGNLRISPLLFRTCYIAALLLSRGGSLRVGSRHVKTMDGEVDAAFRTVYTGR